ncbi:MAG: tetratricopeptide repeat protein, partial [FCB group bacterium]|nr:tetratricopeptide repeat protein [FCB group bacterium]
LDPAHAAFKELSEKHADDALAPYARFQLGYVLLAREESENAAIEFSNVAAAESADPALRAESRYLAAETYDKLGWYEPAVKAYQQLKQDFPDSEFARKADYGYAWALFHAGKFDEASKAAEALLKAQPEGDAAVGLKYLQASCLQQQKKYEPALALYRELVSNHAGSEFAERARYKIPWTLYLAGDTAAAKADLTRFLETNQNERYAGEAAFLLGSILLAEQNYADACTQFTLVAERFPGSEFAADALFKAGECRTKLTQPAEAAKAFEDFATRYPDHALAGEAILRAGDAQFSAAAFEQAVQKYKKLLEMPADPSVEEETLYRLAVTYHNMREYKSSANAFRTLADKFPQGAHTAEAQLRIGDYHLYEAKDPVKAMQSYEAAQKADANNSLGGRALKGLALARYESKDYEGAAELLLKLIEDQPVVDVGEKIYAWVGQRMYDAKKWEEASLAFAALLKQHPDYTNADAVRLQLGLAKEAAGKHDEALAAFEELAQNPESPYAAQAKFHLAKAYDAKMESDKAAGLYEEIANTNSGDLAAEARFRLGELAEAKDDPKAASEHYMRVAILFLHEQLTPESLWRAGQCFEKLESIGEARKVYQELVATYPESEPSAKAQDRLAQLKAASQS